MDTFDLGHPLPRPLPAGGRGEQSASGDQRAVQAGLQLAPPAAAVSVGIFVPTHRFPISQVLCEAVLPIHLHFYQINARAFQGLD